MRPPTRPDLRHPANLRAHRTLLAVLVALSAMALVTGFSAPSPQVQQPAVSEAPPAHEVSRPAAFTGVASWYGEWFRGKPVACGGHPYDPDALTAAHRSLPCGTRLRLEHGPRSVVVTVTDRGPFVAGRVLDLTPAAFSALADPDVGLVAVRATHLSS